MCSCALLAKTNPMVMWWTTCTRSAGDEWIIRSIVKMWIPMCRNSMLHDAYWTKSRRKQCQIESSPTFWQVVSPNMSAWVRVSGNKHLDRETLQCSLQGVLNSCKVYQASTLEALYMMFLCLPMAPWHLPYVWIDWLPTSERHQQQDCS